MKQKDIALIVVMVVISAVISLVVSNMLFAKPSSRQAQVPVISKISSSFAEPDKQYFNDQSIDPTKLITIDQSGNADPFSGN